MDKTFYTTIGLEIHAELNTKSKMFCGCANDPDEQEPNVNICHVCTAQPGSLPVANKEAIKKVMLVGLAINGEIADFTEFDRKNYFYPDIPKAYQISQDKHPIVRGGELNGVKITRIHLEEDTATSKHDRGDYSLIDFNRSGVPLMELVTEPVIHTPKEASDFGRELQLLLRYLGVSEANMEKGQMRIELNISVSDSLDKLGTKVEVKNINSFRSVERAALYERERMVSLLEKGEGNKIIQETRGWDETKQQTFSQREKVDSKDYRYFPDPDLPKIFLSEIFNLNDLRKEIPELPKEKRIRYKNEYGIKDEDIETYISDFDLNAYFEKIALSLKDKEKIKIASNYITSDYLGLKKVNPETNLPDPKNFEELINMIVDNEISSRSAKDILAMIVKKDESPRKIAEENNMIQKNNEGEIKDLAVEVINKNPKIVETYKNGKENAIMSLVGQVMKESKGSANPQLTLKLLKELI